MKSGMRSIGEIAYKIVTVPMTLAIMGVSLCFYVIPPTKHTSGYMGMNTTTSQHKPKQDSA